MIEASGFVLGPGVQLPVLAGVKGQGMQAPRWNDRQKTKTLGWVNLAGNQLLALGNKVMGQDQALRSWTWGSRWLGFQNWGLG